MLETWTLEVPTWPNSGELAETLEGLEEPPIEGREPFLVDKDQLGEAEADEGYPPAILPREESGWDSFPADHTS